MIRMIISNSKGQPSKNKKVLLSKDYSCETWSQGKLITRPSTKKVDYKSSPILQRIHSDICGSIHPACGPLRYFMVLMDASCKWSHVYLLFTCNIAFACLLVQIIKHWTHFLEYPINSIRMNTTDEFTSKILMHIVSLWESRLNTRFHMLYLEWISWILD